MTLLYLWGLILLLTAIAIAGAVTVCRAAELSPKPEAQALTPEKLASLESRKELFHYDALERPDPFRPFINFSQIERSIPTDATRSLSPLEKYALNQFNLVGIILAGDNNNYALVEDPDHTGYTVREGDKIGNLSGQVQSIESNAVIIEEPYLDIFDKRQVRTISLKLREIDESADLATQIK
ncbi:MAG: pilus assembly protein PilP [Deltaproteobacteria bacterium]|nr:pilus assembly protein PilP [Deltaproteobacteria bacterium]